MERLDDLMRGGLRVLQLTDGACFTEDAVLLTDFFRIPSGARAVDLGAGCGILSILGQDKTGARFCGVESSEPLCALATRSAALNGQDIPFYCMDVRDAPEALGRGAFEAAVCNPPYFEGSAPDAAGARALARHAAEGELSAFCAAAFQLLKNGGRFFLCYPVSGLTRLVCALTENRLEPKRMRLVSARADGAPYLVLTEAKKLAKPGLAMLPTLYLEKST